MDCPVCQFPNAVGVATCARCGSDLTTPQLTKPMNMAEVPPGAGPTPVPGPYGAPPPAPARYSDAPTTPYGPTLPPPEPARLAEGVPVPPPAAPPRPSHLVRNVVLAVGLLALIGGAAGAYLLYQAVNKPNVPVARLLPPEVYGYFSVVPQPKGAQKEALDKLQATFKSQPGFQAAWDKLTVQATAMGQGATGSADCPQETGAPATGTPADPADLSSYLGNNVTIAMLPLSTGELTAMQEGDADMMETLGAKMLFFVDLDFNPLNKQGIVRTIKEGSDQAGSMPLAETYRDTEIRQLPANPCGGFSEDLYLTLLAGTAVVALAPAPLHEPIDRYKDGKSLQDSAAFQALDKELPQERLATLFLNLTAINDMTRTVLPAAGAEDDAATEAVPGLSSSLSNLSRTDGMVALVLTAQGDGLQLDAVSDIKTDLAAAPSATLQTDILKDVPAGSWGFYGGTDMKSAIEQALQIYRKQPELSKTIDDSLDEAKDTLGIDLEEDLLPLLGGDYVLSMKGTQGAEGMDTGLAFELRLKSGDSVRMNDLLAKVTDYLDDEMEMSPEEVQVGNATLWRPDERAPILYGVVGDKLFILGQNTSDYMDDDAVAAEAWARTVLDGQGKGLGADSATQARLGHAVANSNGLLYVDLTAIRTGGFEATLDDEGRASYEEDYAPLVRPLQYLLISGAATQREDQVHTRSMLFLGIGK